VRRFPQEFEAKKEVLFYPRRPDKFSADILEIGPGRGDFILSTATACPEKKLVAIELDKKRYAKIIPRMEKQGLFNILLIQGNARVVLPKYFQPGTFEKIYVLFPDPWPKKRHIPHRLLSVEFIRILKTLLRPGGDFFVATDFWSYADWVTDNLRQFEDLESRGKPFFITSDQMSHYRPSVFEEKWRSENRAIYYLHYKKL